MLADIPGLIEGASDGAGLGTRFLGHVERCAVLVHLVDGTQEAVGEAYRTVREELAAYGHGLEDKDEIVALNKVDALDPETRAARAAELAEAAGRPPMIVSGVSGEGVTALLRAALAKVRRARGETEDEDAPAVRAEWRP